MEVYVPPDPPPPDEPPHVAYAVKHLVNGIWVDGNELVVWGFTNQATTHSFKLFVNDRPVDAVWTTQFVPLPGGDSSGNLPAISATPDRITFSDGATKVPDGGYIIVARRLVSGMPLETKAYGRLVYTSP
ncbi:hypothetical protein [uncultured Thiocystis sp.]|uniref:hypothetical protein n=1 Tax=uncultured Thiocystis sp. TaxID=1202134 RepID=UPI0025E25EC4|nr:hypothetical protein [uncultured Thiocystis sp.]